MKIFPNNNNNNQHQLGQSHLEPNRQDSLGISLKEFDLKVTNTDEGEWVETSPEIIGHFNPKGMNGAKYFLYRGRKICESGKVDEIEGEISTTPWTQKK